MSDGIEDKVRDVLIDVFGLDPADVGPNTSADTVDAWDSLHHLTIVLSLEEEFDLQFGDEETLVMTSFPLIVATVREKQGLPDPS